MKKRILSAICLISLVLTLSACPAGSGDGATTGGNYDTPVITDPTTVQKKPWRVNEYNPPIEVRVVGYDMPYLTLPEGDSRTNNNWTRAYKDELGIITKFDWVCDSSQYSQKIELTLSSGDMPDIITVNAAQLQSLVEQGMIEDLSKVFLEYASDDLREALEQAGPDAIDSATFDGRLMGIPWTGNSIENLYGMWIRTDWLKAVGMEVPKTMEELEKVMIAFAQKDPDGNGKADTYSMDMNKQSFYGATSSDGLFFGFGAWPVTWIEKNGQIQFGGIQPEVKTSLEMYKRLYDAGAINKEFNTIDQSKAQEAITGDKVGLIFGGYYASSTLNKMVANTGKADVWEFFQIPSSTGGPTKPPFETATSGYHVVKKGYAHPEVAVKFANMFVDEFYVNSTDLQRYYKFCQNETGTNAIWSLGLCQVYRPMNNVNNFKLIDKAVNHGDPSAMDRVTFLGKSFYNGGLSYRDKKEGNIDKWFWWVMFCPENPKAAVFVTAKNIDEKNYTPNKMNGLLTPEMSDKYGFLIQKQSQEFQSFVIGTRPLSEFDKYVEEFKANGGQQITDSINKWYNDRAPIDQNVFLTTWGKAPKQ